MLYNYHCLTVVVVRTASMIKLMKAGLNTHCMHNLAIIIVEQEPKELKYKWIMK